MCDGIGDVGLESGGGDGGQCGEWGAGGANKKDDPAGPSVYVTEAFVVRRFGLSTSRAVLLIVCPRGWPTHLIGDLHNRPGPPSQELYTKQVCAGTKFGYTIS